MGTDINFKNHLGRTYGTRIGLPAFDPAAQAYFAARGITGATQQAAIDTLVKGLKTDGIWSKMKAIYPFVTDNRNLWSYTNDVTAGNWVRSGFTATANSTTAPDGTTTADTLTENTSGGNHYISNQATAIALSNGNCTMSIYVKKIVRDWFVVSLFDGTTGRNAWFNINTGVVGTVQSGATASISDAGNGWYRCSITMPMSASNVNFTAYYGANADNSVVYTGNGLASYYVWGAQLEIGSLSTYQPIATTQQAYIASQFKYNLKDPRDLDAAFRLVFNGGWTFSTTGALPNGTNGFADTKFDQTLLSQTNGEIGVYSRTNIKATYIDIGVYAAANDYTLFTYVSLSGDQMYGKASCPDISSGYNPINSLGLFSINADGVNTQKFYKNGILGATKNVTSGATTSKNIYLSAGNGAASPIFYSTRQLALSYISQTLNATEAANLYTRVQAYQTSLNRQV